MTVILQISDPHFGTERPPVVQALRELTRELKPDLLVLSGDLTQRARVAQFAKAADFVRELAVPNVLAVPGNHDLPLFDLLARALHPYANYARFFGHELEPRFEAADCVVLGVNTTRRYRHIDGEISLEQCERVAKQLRRASPAQLRLVVLHQPLAVPRASERKNVVHGHARAMATWAEAGADIVLSGHIHLPFALPLHERSKLSGRLWAIGAGTAVSSRIRHEANNSVNVIHTQSVPARRECLVEQWCYRDVESRFLPTVQLRLPG